MIVNIQILRGFAAIMVAWVHCQGLVADGLLPNWAREFGYGGVDLFFVISGYIMVRTTMGKSMSPAIFMKKRIVRIIPLYYFFTLLTALVAISLPDMMNSTEIEFETLIKSLLFIPFEKTPDRIYPILYLGWTLNYEMAFYIIFSASLIINKSVRIVLVAASLAALTFAGLGVENLNDHGVMVYFLTRPILLDFALGMLVAAALSAGWLRISEPVLWWSLLALGAVWIIFGGAFFSVGSSGVAPATDTFLRFGVPAGLIVAAAVGLEQTGTRIGGVQLRLLGDASYSLYLSHYFVVAVFIAAADILALDDLARSILVCVTMVAAIAGGLLTFRLVERPLAGDFTAYRQLGRYLAPSRSDARNSGTREAGHH